MSEDKLYRLQSRFYRAGYEGRRHPIALNTVSNAFRCPLRTAYREGREQHESEEAFLRHMSGGAS